MVIRSISRRVSRKLRCLVASGMLLGVLGGCDPEVQTVVLGGFQDLATTFVDAFFLSIQPDETGTPTGT